MTDEQRPLSRAITTTRAAVMPVRERAQATILWQVWERMLEIDFVDRSIALAGKAFVSFFPLVIVVAAFMPATIRTAILTTLTTRLGIEGPALALAREAFTSADDVRRASGLLGLALTFFFASSFTTALQRIYLRAWRRPPARAVGTYTRGPVWLAGLLTYMAITGGLRGVLGDGLGFVLFLVLAVIVSAGWWWFSAWYLLVGQVRWRVLVPSAVVTSLAMNGYAASAVIWMPNVIAKNQDQFGFFGVAIALVTWFSGAAIAIIVGATAGAVVAEDPGPIGRFVRGPEPGLLVEGASPSLAPPARARRLRDALRSTPDAADNFT